MMQNKDQIILSKLTALKLKSCWYLNLGIGYLLSPLEYVYHLKKKSAVYNQERIIMARVR